MTDKPDDSSTHDVGQPWPGDEEPAAAEGRQDPTADDPDDDGPDAAE